MRGLPNRRHRSRYLSFLRHVGGTSLFLVAFPHCGSGICPIGGCPVPSTVSSAPFRGFRVVAGTTDSGLNGDAANAVLLNDHHLKMYPDGGSFVVTSGGLVAFRDRKRGLLYIDESHVLRVLIPTTGASTGDGGPVSAATLREPSRIALDYQGGLLIADYDRIRRIDLAARPMRIDTLIGGGATAGPDVPARDLAMKPFGQYRSAAWTVVSDRFDQSLVPHRNGDIYFQTEPGAVRVYHPATRRVTSLIASGIGYNNNAAQNLAECVRMNGVVGFRAGDGEPSTFLTRVVCPDGGTGTASLNPSTGAVRPFFEQPPDYGPFGHIEYRFVGRDGEIYSLARFRSSLLRFDATSASWVPVVGTGVVNYSGQCLDGTAALSCDLDLEDAFVDEQSKIFFMDRGRLRTVDASGSVHTLYGTSLSGGDGGPATAARLNAVAQIDVRDDGQVVLLDGQEMRLREIRSDGTIVTIAGNGTNLWPDTAGPATSQGIPVDNSGSPWADFVLEPRSGDVFYYSVVSGEWGITRLSRATGRWSVVAGGGTNLYYKPAAEGLTGAQLRFLYPPRVLGFNGTQLFTALQIFVGATPNELQIKLYASADGKQTSLAGTAGPAAPALCADDTLLSECGLPNLYVAPRYTRATWEPVTRRWLMLLSGTSSVKAMAEGGRLTSFATLAKSAQAFTHRRDGEASLLYYCDTDGALHRKDAMAETDLPLPAGMQCQSGTLVYSPARDALVFPAITAEGLHVVGEYARP